MAGLILVADDSPTIQRKVQKILQDEGFGAETVSNGVAAVKKLSASQPALVLVDVSLPGKDGYEVCEFVKTSADLLHVPVLLLGSDLEPYDEQRGARVRADGIIKKPFSDKELVAMVRKFTGPSEAPASPPIFPDTVVPEPPETAPEPLPVTPLEPSSEPAPATWLQPLPEPEQAVPPEDVVGGSPEPFPARAVPFPVFALESSREAEEASGREAEIDPSTPPFLDSSTSRFFDSPTSQLLDFSAPALEPSLLITEPIADPVPEAASEPALVGPESGREFEEPSGQGGEPSTSRGVAADSSAPSLDPLSFRLLDSSTSQLFPSSRPAAMAGAPAETGPGLVYTIVHKVVTRMAPPALSPQQIEELVRELTREITSELDGTS